MQAAVHSQPAETVLSHPQHLFTMTQYICIHLQQISNAHLRSHHFETGPLNNSALLQFERSQNTDLGSLSQTP